MRDLLHSGLKLGDRYRLDSRIGAGGMGEVWRAFDEVLARVVAVKAMLPEVADDPDFARRFLVEATSMASVNHPAVASIHDYGRGDGITFLVMEFIDGESLSQVLGRAGRLGPADTMRLIAQAADGLQAVHDRGIVHRDIKPANLLIRRDGSLLITDFGISRTQDGTHLTVSGAILGTPTYLSPEQVLGQPATGLSDVYSLGLAAYECLAGRRPFSGDNPYAVALQRLQAGPPALGGDVARPVAQVVERALAIDPADRWRSAAEFAQAARAALHGGAGTGTYGRPSPQPAPSPQPSWPRSPGPQSWPSVSQPSVSQPSDQQLSWQPSGPQSSGPQSAAAPSWAAQRTEHRSAAPGSSAPRPAAAQPGGQALADRPVADPPREAPGREPSRRWAVAAVLLVTVVIGGVTGWQFFGDHSPGEGPAGAAGTPRTSAAAQTPGLTPCGPILCPAEPLCWGGLTASSGRAETPWQTDCTQAHTWETFAAFPLPAAAAGGREDELITNPAIAEVCTAALMAEHSPDRKATAGWVRDAWPIQVDGTGPRLIHCLARPETGEPTTSAF